MQKKLENYVASSIYEAKKAISEYNDLLEERRIEQFIIHICIAFNRLFIAYCMKFEKGKYSNLNEKTRIPPLSELLSLVQKQEHKLLNDSDESLIRKLIQIRHKIEHNIITEQDFSLEDAGCSLFSWWTIYIYKFILSKIDKSENLKLYVIGDATIKSDINNDTGSWYAKDINDFISSQDKKYLENIPIAQIVQYKDLLSSYEYCNFLPGMATKVISEKIKNFSIGDFINICKVFSIFCSKIGNYPKNFNEYDFNPEYAEVKPKTAKYVNRKFIDLIISVCKKRPEYKIYFKSLVDNNRTLKIDDYKKMNDIN